LPTARVAYAPSSVGRGTVTRQGQRGRRESDNFDRIIGDRLRQERWLSGKSREELGLALGVGGEVVHAYECGKKRLRPEHLEAATSALGVPIWLLFYPDVRGAPSVADDEDVDVRPTLAVRRPPAILDSPGFAQVTPIVTLWQTTRGELSDDVHRAILGAGLFGRTILVRQASAARLIIEHLGAGIAILRPCETLLAMGRELHDMPDGNYGAWVAQAYDEALLSRGPRFESVRASVRTSRGTTLRTRYNRVIMPWRGKGSEMYVMGVSIRQESPEEIQQA
jgi:transcriptional regulator with XRE-family HTH domain